MKTKIKKTPNLEQFRAVEVIDFDGESIFEAVEEADGRMMATVRIIKAGLSKNNRNYRVSALKKAAQEGIFDGVRMFTGHSKKGPLERPFDSMVSAIESTEYDEDTKSLNGRVEFFDPAFYDRVNRAKRYMGVSIDSMLSGTRTPDPRGGRALEDIHAFTQPRSVDWVLYPAAGGEILAMESEGDGVTDWAAYEADISALTEEDLKKNLPSLWAKFHPENHGQPPVHGFEEEEEEDDPPKKTAKKSKSSASEFVAKEEVETIVTARLEAYEKEKATVAEKQRLAAEQVKLAFAGSGLPDKTRARVMQGFEGVEEFDEKKVKKAITDAQEELKAAGAGPRITGMGPSGSGTEDKDGAPVQTFSVKESVESAFGKKKPDAKKDDDPADKKEQGK